MPLIRRININNSIAPWIIYGTSDEDRSYQINYLRRVDRNDSAYRNYEGCFIVDVLNLMGSNTIFPPVRRTIDRIWRDYIYPVDTVSQNQFFDISPTTSSNTILDILSNNVRFDNFNRVLRIRDRISYKYCVLIAAFNVLYQIFKFHEECGIFDPPNRYRFFPIDHIILNPFHSSTTNTISRIGTNSYKFNIHIEKFLQLFLSVPMPETIDIRNKYLYFWSNVWQCYYDSMCINGGFGFFQDSRRTSRTPRLMEEYFRREVKQLFISKEQLISMISESVLPEKVLNSIYDIVTYTSK